MPKKHNKLTILEELPHKIYQGKKIRRERMVRCRCDCGKEVVAPRRRVIHGRTKACRSCSHSGMNNSKFKHGHTSGKRGSVRQSPEYKIWAAMLDRCRNPNNTRYEWYGARGITVCEQWLDFQNFLSDMGPRPSQKHTIERVKNEEGYNPSNCKWATMREQRRNRRVNRMITHNGKTLCLMDWAEETGQDRRKISYRLNHGWSVEEALFGKR